ncbi:mechanosensitive ion channel domain-containing protein [Gallaecimonas sp. GXIMD1310]|uniref:mechanosensitive ion channel domain-containing protein n=1 Tax=Gallaecimonas sp. GXIMD1310 TaxID=3131926 RepID=UPI003243BAE2
MSMRYALLSLLLSFSVLANSPIKILLKQEMQSKAKAAAQTSDPQSQQIAAAYSEAAQLLDQRNTYQQQAADYQHIIDNFPTLQAEKAQALRSSRQATLPDYRQWPEDKLDQSLAKLSGELQKLNDQLDTVLQQQSRINNRLGEASSQATKLKQEQNDLQQQLDNLSGSDALTQAKRAQMRARYAMLSAWIHKLELEDASANQRLQLKELDQEKLTTDIAQHSVRLSALQTALNSKRQARLQDTLLTSLHQHFQQPYLQKLAAQSIQYAQHLTALNDDIARTQQRLRKVKSQNLDWREYQATVAKQMEWLKVSAAFGETLRIRYDQLPSDFHHRALIDAISQARIDKYEYDQALKAPPPEQQLASLSAEQQTKAKRLLQTRRELLQKLSERTFEYLNHLTQLELATGDLEKTVTALRTLIEGHLFWIPNARPLNLSQLAEQGAATVQFFSHKLTDSQPRKLAAHPLLILLLLGLSLLAVLIRWLERHRLRRRLAELAKPVGNVTRDSIRYTLMALLISLGYATPLPLLFITLALISGNSQPALASAMLAGAGGTALWLTLRNLTHEEGLLQGHFRWREAGVRRLRILVRRLALVATPLLMLMLYCQQQENDSIRQGLGRITFMVMAAGLAFFYQQLYKHRRLLVYNMDKGVRPRAWHHLLWWLAIAVPLVSLGLAVSGYYYSAQQLLLLEQLSLLTACGYGFIYYLAKRWLLIERRKIAFAQAKAKRAELLAQRENDNTEQEHVQEVPSEESLVDLDAISSQSITLLRTLFKLLTVLSLLLLWSPMYDALSYLEHIVLWHSTTLVDGQKQALPVTLMALIWAAITIMLTVISSRNLPGLLELALLQRLQLSPGSSFALTTVSRYLVIVVGMVTTFGLLGIEWSQAQWLVAALTVGLGFGLQEIFANFVSGLIILFEKPIRIGDTVTIRELSGTITRINTRATTLVDWDNKEIIVPNKAFITEQLVNWSLSDSVTRLILKVGINHGSDTEQAERLLLDVARRSPLVLSHPEPSAYLLAIGPSSLDFELRVYVADTDNRLPASHALYTEIHRRFAAAGITLAWPKLDLQLAKGIRT